MHSPTWFEVRPAPDEPWQLLCVGPGALIERRPSPEDPDRSDFILLWDAREWVLCESLDESSEEDEYMKLIRRLGIVDAAPS